MRLAAALLLASTCAWAQPAASVSGKTLMEQVREWFQAVPSITPGPVTDNVMQRVNNMTRRQLEEAFEQANQSRRATYKLAKPEGIATQLQDEVRRVIARAMPSVVHIAEGKSVGTGFFIARSGTILTNNHVVSGVKDGGTLTVTLGDKTQFEGKVLYADESRDLALVAIDGKGRSFPELTVGSGDRTDAGMFVVALGHPYNVQFTATFGIVSAVRSGSMIGLPAVQTLVQTDTAINPGNSGGPLIGLDGVVVGVNESILSPGRQVPGYDGIGFAVGAADVWAFLESARGRVR